EQEAIDLYHFTRLLNRSLDEEGRLRMVEMMWQVVYADHQVTEFEDNLIWRAADLLGVSQQERIALRERVAGGPAAPPGKPYAPPPPSPPPPPRGGAPPPPPPPR